MIVALYILCGESIFSDCLSAVSTCSSNTTVPSTAPAMRFYLWDFMCSFVQTGETELMEAGYRMLGEFTTLSPLSSTTLLIFVV